MGRKRLQNKQQRAKQVHLQKLSLVIFAFLLSRFPEQITGKHLPALGLMISIPVRCLLGFYLQDGGVVVQDGQNNLVHVLPEA